MPGGATRGDGGDATATGLHAHNDFAPGVILVAAGDVLLFLKKKKQRL